jgi:hypothetical protein
MLLSFALTSMPTQPRVSCWPKRFQVAHHSLVRGTERLPIEVQMNNRFYTQTKAGRFLAVCLLSFICVSGGNGCHSPDKPASSSFASVTITGNTPGQIRDAAIEVFRADGYKVTQREPSRLVFEKEGTRMNNVAYGSWVGGTPVWVRVKGSIAPAGEMTHRLQCTAFMVQDFGGPTEEEIPVTHFHRAPYQKLLDEVAKRLTQK